MGRWQDDAACKGMTEVMYPSRGDYEGLQRALAICDSCTVRAECFDYVVEIAEPEGIWAGTTGRQRREMRAQMPKKVAQHGTRAKYCAGCRCVGCTDANTNYQRGRGRPAPRSLQITKFSA